MRVLHHCRLSRLSLPYQFRASRSRFHNLHRKPISLGFYLVINKVWQSVLVCDSYCTFSYMQGKILARELDHNYRRICLGFFRCWVCCYGGENSLCDCVFAGLSPMRQHLRNSDRLATSLACKILRMLGIYPRFSVVLTRIHEADVL